ncbi:TonB-dependent siderophore receptor [Chitinophaga sp. RAB17]|uniref:TonB-dependent siderophore receptor n=1 Tax=Chitinophaga sp. RAB17 TaxID=3233049 RepID=UPI003F8F6734
MRTTHYFFCLACFLHAAVVNAQRKDSTLHHRDLRAVDVLSRKNRDLVKDTLPASLKQQLTFIEMPQNIIGISAELIKQQGGLELKDVARNASGVYFGYNSTPFDHSSSIQIRGFSAYSIINGMPRHANYGAVLDDEALFESVDVIKGPAGFVNSVGEASGTININTKTPGSRLLNVTATAGSFGMGRIAVDAGSNVKSRGFSYRFNAAYQHRNSYLDELKTDKYVLAPVLQYNFRPNTYLLAEYDLIRGETRNGSDITKIRTAADALHDGIGLNYGAAVGLPKSYYQAQTMRLLFSHAINSNWKLTSQSQYNLSPYDTWSMLSSETYTGVSFDEQGQTARLSSHAAIGGKTFASQLYFNGKVITGAFTHQLIIGGDITSSRDSLQTGFGLYTFPLYRNKLNYSVNRDSVAIMNPGAGSVFRNNLTYESAYVYDNIKFTSHWILSLGGRFTWYNNKTIQKVTPSRPAKENLFSQRAFSPRAALTYLIDSTFSAFFLYDQSFVPQSGLKAGGGINEATGKSNGVPVDPQRNNDMELGVKKQWYGARLLSSVNAFHTVKRNVLMPDVQNAALNFKRQIGEYASDGVEVDILGRVNSRISVSANYTFVNARITKDTAGSALIGNKLPGTPQQIINTWVQYSMPLKGNRIVAVSLGQTTQVKRSTYTKDVSLPDYTKFDAGINFSAPHYYARLVVDNLLNKRYVTSGDIGSDYPIPNAVNYFFIEGDPVNFKFTIGIKL